MAVAGELAQLARLDPERIEELQTAVAEACLNAMKHGNEMAADSLVEVEIEVAETRLSIDVRDEGRGGAVPETAFDPPDLAAQMSGLQPAGGMGLFVIRSFVDSATFIDDPDREGNQFRMIIHLEPDA